MATMAAELCPEAVLVEGGELFKAYCETRMDGKINLEIEIIHIRTVQLRQDERGVWRLTGFAWPKNVLTWGKLSSKTGDYGWLPAPDPSVRIKLVAGDRYPIGVGSTKLAAWKSCLRTVKARLERAKKFDYGPEAERETEAEIAMIERRIAAERRPAKPRAPRKKKAAGATE